MVPEDPENMTRAETPVSTSDVTVTEHIYGQDYDVHAEGVRARHPSSLGILILTISEPFKDSVESESSSVKLLHELVR